MRDSTSRVTPCTHPTYVGIDTLARGQLLSPKLEDNSILLVGGYCRNKRKGKIWIFPIVTIVLETVVSRVYCNKASLYKAQLSFTRWSSQKKGVGYLGIIIAWEWIRISLLDSWMAVL
jgi:hypothetical protein